MEHLLSIIKLPKYWRFVLLLLLLAILDVVKAQTSDYRYSIKEYGIEQGLSHNQVLQVFQDRRGLIWMLAKDQLNRFDGREFYHFNKTEQVFDDYSRILFEDDENDLWILSDKVQGRLTFINTYTDKIRSLSEKFDEDLLPNDHPVEAAQKTINGISVINTEGQIFRLIEEQFVPVGKLEEALDYDGLGADEFGNEWWKANIRDNEVIYFLVDKDGNVIKRFPFALARESSTLMPNGGVLIMTEHELHLIDKNGDLLLGELPTEVSRYNKNYVDFVHYNLEYDAAHDWIWFQGINHFMLLNRAGEVERNLLQEFPLLRVANVYSMMFSSSTGTWISSIKGAINIQVDREKFQKILWKDPAEFASSDFLSFRGITKSMDGLLYMGANGRMYVKDSNGIEEADRLRGYSYAGVLTDGAGSVWAGAPDTMVAFKGKEVAHKWFGGKGAYTTILEHQDKLWYGVKDYPGHDLAVFDPVSKTYTAIDLGQRIPFDASGSIFDLHPAGENQLWLVSTQGLFLFDTENGIIERYAKDQAGKFQFPVEDFKHLYQDEDGIMWLASTQGLLRWDRVNEETKLYTTQEGLSHNNLYCVYEDDYGYLWMSSDNGIIQFHKVTEKITAYFTDVGVTNNEFNWASHYQDTDGVLYFGGLNGVTSFHPKEFKSAYQRSDNTPLVLTDVHVRQRGLNTKRDLKFSFFSDGVLRILPKDRLLSLKFALLKFENNDLVQYDYRITGLQEEWVNLSGNQLMLGELAYGDAIIEIRGRAGNGAYSSNVLSIPISVIRPWYNTSLAQAGAILLIALIGWLIQLQRTKRLANANLLLEQKVLERTKKINEQKVALEALDNTKTRFFTNLAHELRTPLTLINGPIQKVLNGDLSKEIERKLLLKADASGKQLLELVNELLDLARLEVGTLEVEESPINIADFVSAIVAQFQSAGIGGQSQLIQENKLTKDIVLLTDATKLRKVLNNLLLNAHKFTPREKRITLKLHRQLDWLLIEVEDEGRGIPPAAIDKIFDRFYQVDDQKEAEGGTGIGLALVRELIDIMGGRIEVVSTLGLGSTFSIFLPWKVVDEAEVSIDERLTGIDNNQEASIEKPIAVVTGASKPRLLIVEDNHHLREYLELILAETHQLIITKNGKEALDYLSSVQKDGTPPPDLIISDLMMPVLDGFELANRLKSNPHYAMIPLVILSARAERKSRLRALRIGIDDYLLKPFDEEELQLRIKNLLDNAKNREPLSLEQQMKLATSLVKKTAGKDQSSLTEPNTQEWLAAIESACLEQLSDDGFSLAQLATQFHASRSTFFRKIKAATGLTPSAYLKEIRLQEARRLLENRSVASVQEVTVRVGLSKASYFSKLYRERFGRLPSSYFAEL